LESHEMKQPTCTEDGWDSYETCIRCDYTTYEKQGALGHDLVGNEAKLPTCTESGWESYETCTRCEHTTLVLLEKLNHVYTATVVVPTCTDQGYTIYVCVCEDAYTGDYVDALGCCYGADIRVEATCTQDGRIYRVCERCHGEQDVSVLPATGHVEGDWIVDREAQDNQAGIRHKECVNCGEVTEEESIPALTASFSGCGSNMAGASIVSIGLLCGVALFVYKRKEE
jgi:hypothetical protein